ncbi:MAG: S41 family peptidase [Anaerolineales bacterium]
MGTKRHLAGLTLLLVALLVFSFLGGYLLRGFSDLTRQDLLLVKEALAALEQYSLVPLPDSLTMERAMIHAAVGTLDDPFSVYVEPVEHELQSDDLAGEYGGIGALLTIGRNGEVILTPYEQGPAFKSGIKAGDLLKSVDGSEIPPFPDLSELTAALRGPEGSKVQLGVISPETGNTPIQVELTRQRIDIPSVTAYLSPIDASVGVIQLIRFADSSPEEVRRSYQKLREEGVQALILDLRDNGGGLLESTVSIARLFLEKGLIFTEVDARGEAESFQADDPGLASDIPLAVLINGNTASAAEVLAASLKENGRAVLIGNRTFGKGTVQAVVELSDGSSLHITTARWLTPMGQVLDRVGLDPDYAVVEANSKGPDPYLAIAQQVLLEESAIP